MLTTDAVEVSLLGRSGVYDIAVPNQRGELVALFRDKSTRIKGDVIAGLQAHAQTGSGRA